MLIRRHKQLVPPKELFTANVPEKLRRFAMASKNNYAQELLTEKKNPNDSFSVGLGDDGNLFRWEL